jgi:tellurite resistance-related uncharacterized protein
MSDDMPNWPSGLAAYRRTAEFTEQTCPRALQQAHSTKAGVWAMLHVEEGAIRFRDLVNGTEWILDKGVHPVIFPQRLHEVELIGPVRFFVEFHAGMEQGRT